MPDSGYRFSVQGLNPDRVGSVWEQLQRLPGQAQIGSPFSRSDWGMEVVFIPQGRDPKGISEMVLKVTKWFDGHPEMYEPLEEPLDTPRCKQCGLKMRPAGSMFVCEGCGSTQERKPPDDPDAWDGGDFGGDPAKPPQVPPPGHLSAAAEVPST